MEVIADGAACRADYRARRLQSGDLRHFTRIRARDILHTMLSSFGPRPFNLQILRQKLGFAS